MSVPFSFDQSAPDVIQHFGRWFINGGRPGFNSPANNRGGYETEAKARAVMQRYANKAKRTPTR